VTNTLAAIGATIPASEIRPGYIIDIADGPEPEQRLYVERAERAVVGMRVSGFPTGHDCCWWYLRNDKLVKVLGYFNPENR